MKVAISTTMPVSRLLSHIQKRRRRSRALAAYANYAVTNFGPSSARGQVNAYCVALMHSIPTAISPSPSAACLPTSASFALDSSQEDKTYTNKVFDEDEDKDDAILITALPSLPFCCHADLILMTRTALISVADHINAYLPSVAQIPVDDGVKSEDIRRIIEEMVGLREKGGAAQEGDIGGVKSGCGIGRTVALESSNSFFGPQGTHRRPGKSVTFARPLFASLDNASDTSIISPIIDSSSLHQSPTPAPSNPHSHAPSTSDMSIATSYGAPIVSSLLPGSFSQLSQYTSHTQSQSQLRDISGSGSVLFQCQSASQIGSPTPTPPRSHASYPQPQSLPVSPPRSHSRRGLLSPGRPNCNGIPLNPSLSTPIISSYSHRFTTSYTSPALSQSLWSIPEAFLPHAPEFDLETALSLRRNEGVDLDADFDRIGGVEVVIGSDRQTGVEDQVESAIGEGRVDARPRSWGRTSVLRPDDGGSDRDESADDEEDGVDMRTNESTSARGGRAEEYREDKVYEAGEGGDTSDTDADESASASVSGVSEIGEEEGTATETEDEGEVITESESDTGLREQGDDSGVGSEDEREGMVMFGEAQSEDQCARKAMYVDGEDKAWDGRLLQEVQQQVSVCQFGEDKELSASEFGLGLDVSPSLVDVVTTRVHPSSAKCSASSQDEDDEVQSA